MSWLQGLILGLVQGLAEFLPISSSGHLTIFQEYLGLGGENNLAFDVAVHFATVLSTIILFRKTIAKLCKGLFCGGMNDEKAYLLKILVSMIPVAVVGLYFKEYIERIFSTSYVREVCGNGLLVVGVMLMITGILLMLSEKITARQASKAGTGSAVGSGDGKITYLKAFVIGVAQAIAALPGLSRSGSTIATGLLLKVKRSAVAQFSFLMVIIPIAGESLLSVYGYFKEASNTIVVDNANGLGLAPLVAGFFAAFISGLFACRWMVSLVKKIKLGGFALYCLAAGLLCVVVPYLLK